MLKNFVKGLIFGAAAGTVGGLMFAPRSGNETRKKLIEELDEAAELTEELNYSLKHFKSSLAETQQTASTLIPAFKEGINRDIEDFKFQAAPRVEQIKEQSDKLLASLPEIEEK